MKTIEDVTFSIVCEGGFWNAYAEIAEGVHLAETQGTTPVTAMMACEAAARIALRKRSALRLVP